MIIMNADALSFEITKEDGAWDHLARSPINVLMISENNKLNTRVVFEPVGNGSYITRLEVEMPMLMNPHWHMLAYHAIQSVVGSHGYLEFLVNQHCAYRYLPSEGNAGMLDSETFKEPTSKGFESTLTGTEHRTINNPEFMASLYKGGEVKLDDDLDTDQREPRAPRNQHIRDQMTAMAVNLDNLEKIHQHIIQVYPSEQIDDIGIAFEYEGLNYLVNMVDGEEDLAAVMNLRGVKLVGIFLHDNVFVTKGHVRAPNVIDASGMSPYDFNALMVNYAALDELQLSSSNRRRAPLRVTRGRGIRRGSRDRGNRLD